MIATKGEQKIYIGQRTSQKREKSLHCASFNCVFFAFQIQAFTFSSRMYVMHCFESVLWKHRKKKECSNDELLKERHESNAFA